jgi:hypothetical protein
LLQVLKSGSWNADIIAQVVRDLPALAEAATEGRSQESIAMKKQYVLVSVASVTLAGSLCVNDALAQHKAPNTQPPQAAEAAAPAGDLALGSVRLPKGVSADGKPLAAGSYTVRLTAQEAGPAAVGVSEKLERWVEFVQGGTVKGREVVSIVPQAEVKMVVKDPPPPAGGSKVQTLKGNDYVRVWFNKAGNHYLIYLPSAGAASGL